MAPVWRRALATARRHDADAAELADHDAAPGEGAGRPAQLLGLAHGGDRRPRHPVTEALQGVDRLVAADAVGGQADVALEVVEGPRRQRAEDAVDPPGVEAEATEAALQLGDVVAAQVGGAVVEEAVTEVPAGLDEGGPRLLVAAAVDSEAPGALERPDGRLGGGAVAPYLGAAGREAGGTEAALKVTDSFAGVSRPQREPVGRNSFSSSSN